MKKKAKYAFYVTAAAIIAAVAFRSYLWWSNGEARETAQIEEPIPAEPVAYSLGNFIAAQKIPDTDVRVILKVTLEKFDDDSISVAEVEEIPTWVHRYREKGKMRYVVELGEKPSTLKN